MGRAPCCDKANVKRGPWSPEEDTKLKAYIHTYGTGNNWIALPQKIGLKRCGKSCRLRWLNYLRPNIKHGGFSEEEDSIICSLYISIGSRWSIIAAQLPGRTDNDIKNYWNTRLKKKLLGRRKNSYNISQDPKVAEGAPEDNLLSNSAIERLQLHMHLQYLQTPFSDAALWPKLNPLQENMIQPLQSFNDNSNPLIQPIIPQLNRGHIISSQAFEPKMYHHQLVNTTILDSNVVTNSNFRVQTISTFENELDNFLNNNSMMWWPNDQFETNSASTSNSWDSTSALHHQSSDHRVYQEFALGYNNMQHRHVSNL